MLYISIKFKENILNGLSYGADTNSPLFNFKGE